MATFSKPLRIVLDTNAIISSIARKSRNKIIIDKLLNGDYDIVVTTDMLLEYEEKIAELFDQETADGFLEALDLLPNVHRIHVYYRFLLITNDADDDKFADCAIAAGVHFLVSDDRHYRVLKKLGFPEVNLLKIDEFIEILKRL
jgi:uncharacterized protein